MNTYKEVNLDYQTNHTQCQVLYC